MGSKTVEDRFYILDNSAVFTAAIAGAAGPFVFRLSCELEDTVRLPFLSLALERLHPRFPFLFVALGHGVFWHYLDPVTDAPRIERETDYPAAPIAHRRGRALVRVIAYGRRIACEFHHAITDGSGGMAFLRALVVEYLLQLDVGIDVPRSAFQDIPRPGDPYDPEEEEDAYDKYFRKEAPLPDSSPPAFLMPGRRQVIGYSETVGRLSLPNALAAAKDRQATLTELLASVHIAALQDLYEAMSPLARRKARKTITVQIPVNLRKMYPSRTLRNFFLFAAPSIDLRLGFWTFDEILRRVHHSMRIGLEPKELLRQMRRNVGSERNPFNRVVFLPLKEVVLRIVNSMIGVGSYSGSLSNLGAVFLPEPFASKVIRFGILPARSRVPGANVGVLSWKNELFITIGSLVETPDFERAFFRRLVSLGLPVAVESNRRFVGVRS
ncbi:MAG: hypothetical protein WCT14_00550 [Treponemataceae bacterium]